MPAFVERYCIEDVPVTRPAATPVKVAPQSPLRAAEEHLAQVLVKLAQFLHICAKELTAGEPSCYVLVDTLSVLVDELDGRNRGLLLHVEADSEYERRRKQFPAVHRQVVIAASAVRQLRRQIWDGQKIGMDAATAAPLTRMIEQTIVLLFTIARGLERDNQDMRDCIRDAMKQFEDRWCKMENMVTDICYGLPAETGKALRQSVGLLGGAANAIYTLVELVFRIDADESSLPDHRAALAAAKPAPPLPTPRPRLPEQNPSRMPMEKFPIPKPTPSHWLKTLFVRH